MRHVFTATTTFYEVPVRFYDDFDPEWHEPPNTAPEDESAGWFDRNRMVIHVKAGSLPAASVADTLLHEVGHLVALAGGAGGDGLELDEENWTNIMTAGWKQLLTEDNDDLLAYLGANL